MDLKNKIREILDEVNSNIAKPSRLRMQMAKKGAIALIFIDTESDLGEHRRNSIFQPDEAKALLKEQKTKLQELLENPESKNIEQQINASEELRRRLELEKQVDGEIPISLVFQILAGASIFCEENYHDIAKLKQFKEKLVELVFELNARS